MRYCTLGCKYKTYIKCLFLLTIFFVKCKFKVWLFLDSFKIPRFFSVVPFYGYMFGLLCERLLKSNLKCFFARLVTIRVFSAKHDLQDGTMLWDICSFKSEPCFLKISRAIYFQTFSLQ